MPKFRATTSTGTVIDDPVDKDIAALVRAVSAEDGAFLLFERCEDRSGNTYLQTMNAAGFIVERRDGARERHYRADAISADVVTEVFVSWSHGTNTWQTLVNWQWMKPLAWWQRRTRTHVGGVI